MLVGIGFIICSARMLDLVRVLAVAVFIMADWSSLLSVPCNAVCVYMYSYEAVNPVVKRVQRISCVSTSV